MAVMSGKREVLRLPAVWRRARLQQVKFAHAPDEPCPPHAAAARGRGAAINLEAIGSWVHTPFPVAERQTTSAQGLIPDTCWRLYVWYGHAGE